jgi:signal transduction histidine kinase
MSSPKRFFLTVSKFTIVFFALLTAPQYLAAQTYQQDTSTINRLLISAKSKRFSDSATALRECFQALALAKKHNDGLLIYDTYHRLGRIHEVNNQYAKAHHYFLAELTVEHMVSDSVKQFIYSEIAGSYMYFGEFNKAFELLMKNYALGLKTKKLSIQQQSCVSLGQFYQDINEFEKATQYYIKSIGFALNMNNPDELCDSYCRLADVYMYSKNYDLALKSFEKALPFIDKINNNTYPRYYVLLSGGTTYLGCGKYKEALVLLEKALILSKAEEDISSNAGIYVAMADTYTKMNDLKNAERCYKECFALKSSFSDGELMSYQKSMGLFLLKKGNYDEAISYFNKSIALATAYKNQLPLQSNYTQLSECFRKKGDATSALFYLKKSVALRDSIFSEKNTLRIAEAQFKHDLTQNEGQLMMMEKNQSRMAMIAMLGLLAFLLAFLIYYVYKRSEKNKILTDKNKEIKDKNRQLEESNEILRQFAHASAHDLKEPLRNINSFVNIIQRKYTKDLPAEALEYMGYVTTGVTRMDSLLKALLEYSSVLTYDNIVDKPNDVSSILAGIFQQHKDLMNEKKAVIKVPSVFPTIFMSEVHLKQLLSNLVNNALKYSKTDTEIEIDYRITTTELLLSIKDNGIGMDETYSDKIFKLFQRLDRVTHKESVGIGLTICKNIVDKYAGRLWFDSVVNEGTTFFIAFPKNMISDVPTAKGTPQYFGHFATDLSALNTEVPT